MKKISGFFFLILLAIPALAQKQQPVSKEKTVIVVFYNTENLYDTLDDPHKNDNEFLPVSDLHWNTAKYYKKVHDIARVLASADTMNLPGVIDLAEIENIAVARDLILDRFLEPADYEVILPEGHDPRGIDVALLYRPSLFRCLAEKPFPASPENKSRNLLYVKLLGPLNDTLHFLVNHWKSRAGASIDETAAKRMENALAVRHITDSLLRGNPNARILLMGDFNDNPDDRSILAGLRAIPPRTPYNTATLYNLFYQRFKAGEGTLYFKGWDLFDQVIVSGSFLTRQKRGGAYIFPAEGYILDKPWMVHENKEGEHVPGRTVSGKRYLGGFSDHLPVYVKLRYRGLE